MGHYDSSYEDDRDKRHKAETAKDMKARRKAVNVLNQLMENLHVHTPERFIWSLEDYRRWLLEGLVEWEAETIVEKLKG